MQDKKQPGTPQTVNCRSCGAVYSADLPNCPYCGTMNLPAAEKDYMNRLETVRSGLEELGAEPGKTVKSNLRTLRRRLTVAAVLLLLAVLAGAAVYGVRERREAEKERAEAVWQLEYFQKMDAAYAAGDYDLLNDLYCAAIEDHNVWNYKHWHFCDCYRDIRRAEDALTAYNARQCAEADLLYFELLVLEVEDKESYVTSEEYALLLELRAPVLDDLTQRFSLTEEDLASFRGSIRKNGFLSYTECETFLNERGNQP